MYILNMKLSPELKKVLKQTNISENDCDKKIAERGMHVINMYIKLIHLRLHDNMPDQDSFDHIQHERISELMEILGKQNEDIPCQPSQRQKKHAHQT